MIPRLEQLEARLTPTTLASHGGPIIATPHVFDVFLQSSQPAMNQLAQILVGPYAQMLSPYGIHPGSFSGSATFKFSSAVVHDADIRNLLQTNILSGKLPAPGPSQVYMVYLAPGQSFGDSWLAGNAGYHSEFTIKGKWVYYAVVLAQNNQSVPASHEFAETLTDPIVGTGWFGANITQEEGDLENWNYFNLDGFNVTLVTLPNGQVLPSSPPALPSSPPPNPKDLSALLIERIFVDLWGYLARLDPAFFASKAQQAQQVLAANPALDTASGQFNVTLADQLFAGWLGQQSL
jgi:hypothetical protein